MYIRYRVSEFDDAGGHAWTWYVDVPEGMEAKPDSYRFTRHKGMYNISEIRKHNMDSPTVKQSGVRDNVETAMRLYFAGRGEVWHENAVKRTEVYRMGKVTRDPSRQTKRLTAPLHVVSMEMKNEILTIGLILDDQEPVRYAAEVRMSDYHRFDKWRILMYRRLNPRSHGKPEYGLRVMPAGTNKATAYITDPINFALIDSCLDKLRTVIPEGTKARTTLEIFARQTRKQESIHWGTSERGKNTISYRIFATATPVCDALRAVQTNPTPDAVAHWTTISETIKANMLALGPKFEARLRDLEAQHFMNREKAKQASQASQTTAGASIPPFPYHLANQRQTPPKGSETPANGTSNPLTAFLGNGATHLAQTPANSPQSEAPAHQTLSAQDVPAWLSGAPEAPKEPAPQQIPPMPELKPIGPEEVESWLANLPKEPIRPPRPASQEPQAQLDGAHIPNALPETDAPVIPPIQKMHTLADVPLEAMLAQADAEYERQKAAGEI